MELVEARLGKIMKMEATKVNELDDLKGHSMKYSLMFNLDSSYTDGKEAQGENCVEIIVVPRPVSLVIGCM